MDSNVARAARLDTATISDALDRLQIAGQCLGIKPRRAVQMAGRAFTVRYGPIDVAAPGTVGDYIDDVVPGTVVVLDNGGREDATVWGGILTLLAHRKAIAGTVIDGACRDTGVSAELGYPLFSRSYSMRTGKGRVASGSFTAPDHPYYSELEFVLTVTDVGGLSDTASVVLAPQAVFNMFQSNPTGASLSVAGFTATT
ncbi:MAG TPA: RraA family protein, partial [Vicinamibacterales bacterium]|nr:RraA family protein [Vicinamibacterales bacterium]